MDDIAKLKLRHRLDRLFFLHKAFFAGGVVGAMALMMLGYGDVAIMVAGVLLGASGVCAIASGQSVVSSLTIGGATHHVEVGKDIPGTMQSTHALVTGLFLILFGGYLALWGASLVFGFTLPW